VLFARKKNVIDPNLLSALGLAILFILDLVSHATRAALLGANVTRLLVQRDEKNSQVSPQGISQAASLFGNLARLQTSLSLSQTILKILIAGLALWIFVPWGNPGDPFLPALITLLSTGLIVSLAEWITEVGISQEPEYWVVRLSGFARIVMALLYPILFLPSKLLGNTESNSEGGVTENELISLMEAGQQEGVLEQEEQKMIVSIFRLGDTLVREIMVPRIDILALSADTPIDQAIDALIKSGHSRVPVFEDSVDNVLGLLYAKDLLRLWREGNDLGTLKELLRPAYFVPESKKAHELLAELQANRIHMAVVVDEYGGVAGLVTMEDIVEEIVGEIQDEYDQSEEQLFQPIDEDEYLFQGRIDLDDFNEIMGSELPREEADTLSGLIYSRIGRVPVAGDALQVDNLKLTIEQITGHRIRKVRAQKLPGKSETASNEKHADG
jgi:CBS domain containing-hemolysin-like protein